MTDAHAIADATEQTTGRSRRLGTALVLASTLFFALSGTFTKTISRDAWTILGWRGLVGGLLIMAYVIWVRRRAGKPIDLKLGRTGWLIAIVNGASGAVFIASFKFTSVANVVVIYALVPFIAAGLAWLWFQERAEVRTLVAAGVCLAGVALTVAGGVGAGHLFGDMLALGMAFGCALYLVMVRRYPNAPSVWASAVGAFLLVPVGLVLGDFSDMAARDALLMTLFGVFFAAAIITWTEGARLIPAPETGLLGSAEIPIAAVLAAILLGELPTLAGVIGGVVVVVAVFGHAMSDRPRPPAEAIS